MSDPTINLTNLKLDNSKPKSWLLNLESCDPKLKIDDLDDDILPEILDNYEWVNEFSANNQDLVYANHIPPRISKLFLSNNIITEFHCLSTCLKHLDLSNNKLEFSVFARFNFECLGSLEHLDLSSNYINKSPENWPPNLKYLDMSSNYLERIPQSVPKSLFELNISHNNIKTLYGANIYDNNFNVCKLNLSYNAIKEALYLPSSVWILDISHNNITRFTDNLLDICELDISGNKLKDIYIYSYNVDVGKYKITKLIANNCNLGYVNQFPPKLEFCDLSYNNLVTIPALKKLKILNLIHNELNPVTIQNINDSLQSLQCLPKIYIHQNNIPSTPLNSCFSTDYVCNDIKLAVIDHSQKQGFFQKKSQRDLQDSKIRNIVNNDGSICRSYDSFPEMFGGKSEIDTFFDNKSFSKLQEPKFTQSRLRGVLLDDNDNNDNNDDVFEGCDSYNSSAPIPNTQSLKRPSDDVTDTFELARLANKRYDDKIKAQNSVQSETKSEPYDKIPFGNNMPYFQKNSCNTNINTCQDSRLDQDNLPTTTNQPTNILSDKEKGFINIKMRRIIKY